MNILTTLRDASAASICPDGVNTTSPLGGAFMELDFTYKRKALKHS